MENLASDSDQRFVEPIIEADKFVFIPLGGSEEIGINVYLYHYAGKWLMIDLGIGFADEEFPGVDVVVPDIEYISKRRKDLVGIVLTHAHEDHLGAIQYLWGNLNCPIYTTRFTAEFLRSKLIDCKLHDVVPIDEIEEGVDFNLGPFKLRFVPLAHSIPSMQAVYMKVGNIKLFHTGDWRIDRPLTEETGGMSIDGLIKIGDEGVTAVVGDSTSVLSHKSNRSEVELYDQFLNLFKDVEGAIVIALFASNVYRLRTISRVAEKLGRTVILSGRSVWRVSNVASSTQYLSSNCVFFDEIKARQIPRNKWIVVCTGCQGEPRAAMTKITDYSAPGEIKVQAGDLVVFSSKVIPGNERKIQKIYNRVVRSGARLVTTDNSFVHVSGHASYPEIKEMYGLLRPKLVIPMHGEAIHIYSHAKLAKECGIATINTNNGDVIHILEDGSFDILGKIQTSVFGVDGNFLQPANGKIMAERRRMQGNGAIFIALTIGRGGFVKSPLVQICGVFDPHEEQKLFRDIVDEVKKVASMYAKKGAIMVSKAVHSAIIVFCELELKKSPLIKVSVTELQQGSRIRSGAPFAMERERR